MKYEDWLKNLPDNEEKEALKELVNVLHKHGLVLKKKEDWQKLVHENECLKNDNAHMRTEWE